MTQRLHMNAHAFKVAVSGTRLTPRSQEVARAVLVQGEPQHAVARRTGLNRQRVNQIVRLVIKSALKLGPCPMCGK